MERTPEGRSDVVLMCYAGHGGMSRTHVRSLFGEKSENWISLSPLNKKGYLLFGSVLSEITYADLSAFRRGCIKAPCPPPCFALRATHGSLSCVVRQNEAGANID